MIERESEIYATLDGDALNSTCTNWDTYQSGVNLVQDDSGI